MPLISMTEPRKVKSTTLNKYDDHVPVTTELRSHVTRGVQLSKPPCADLNENDPVG